MGFGRLEYQLQLGFFCRKNLTRVGTLYTATTARSVHNRKGFRQTHAFCDPNPAQKRLSNSLRLDGPDRGGSVWHGRISSG